MYYLDYPHQSHIRFATTIIHWPDMNLEEAKLSIGGHTHLMAFLNVCMDCISNRNIRFEKKPKLPFKITISRFVFG